MLTNIKNTSKKALSMLLAFVMCFTAVAVCMPVIADAIEINSFVYGRYYYYPKGTQFLSSIRYGQAEKSADANSEAEQDGHTNLGMDFNSGVSGKDYIYLGYKTSDNINDAMATMLRNGHDTGGAETTSFTVNGKEYSFSLTGLGTSGKQDLNADAGGDYIYLYATKDPRAGLPIVNIAAKSSGDPGLTMAGYYTVMKDSTSDISDCNAGAGGDYVYIFYDNISAYTDVTPSMLAFKEVFEKTVSIGDSSCYTAASWQTYKAAYDTAKTINDSYSNPYNAGCYTADEITAAKNTLDGAISGLQGVIRIDAATNGGTTTATEFSSNVGTSTTIVFPGTFYSATKEGHSFLGWSTDKNATNGTMSNMTLPLGTTVYAIFSINKYTVKFVSSINNQEIKSETVNYGSSVTAPEMNSIEKNDDDTHYVFKGWSRDFSNITESMTVIANYEKEDHVYQLISETAPSCSKEGSKIYECDVCGHKKTETLSIIPENHKNTTLYPAKESTCNVPGYTEYIYCNDCHTIISGKNPLPLSDHKWGEWSESTATCTQPGIKTRKCEICKTTEAEDAPATGHSWGDWKVVREATCTVNGRQQRQCPSCKETEVAIINATGHSYEAVVTAPTCTDRGYTTHTCSVCYDSYVDSYVDALDHEWINVGDPIVEATCTTNGKQYQQCTRCYITQEAVIEALGHDWQNETIIKAPSCTENGIMSATCDRCSESQNEIVIPALGHDWDEGVVTVQPTCTTAGNLFMTCLTCQATRNIRIPEVGHNWGDGFLISAPTCTTEGSRFYYCSVCEESKDEIIEKLPHNYVGVVTPPTCTEKGFTTYTCTDCGHVSVDDYEDAPGHANIVTVVPPSCTQKGYTVTRCLVCDNIERTDYVDALGHSYEDSFIAPTCTEKGYTLTHCAACNDSIKKDYVDALGHEYEISVIAPTCTQRGYDEHVCIRGDYSYKDNYVKALGHTYAEIDRIPATQTQSGYILYRCEVETCNNEKKEILYYNGKALVCITLYDTEGNPLSEATVTFTELNSGDSFVLKTDLNGYFTEVLPEGNYEIVISKIGYKDTVGTIDVSSGTADINIPEVPAVECDCYCHKQDFFSKIRRIFAKILALFGTKHECCEHSDV